MSTKATIILLATLLLGLSPLAINAQDFEGLNYYQLEDGRYVYYEGLVPCGKEVFIGSDALGDYNGISTVHLACQFCHLFTMLSAIISFLLVELVPILAVILLVAGGIMYYLALGNPEKLSRANKMLKSTIIGLVIVYGAWMIVGALLTIIGVADWTGLQDGWYTVSCPITEVGYTVDARPRLLVEVEGRGTVASVTPGDLDIKCGLKGNVCSKFVDEGTVVKLEATADSGGSFKEWKGACKGSSGLTCEIIMDESKIVEAVFGADSYNLVVNPQGCAARVTTKPEGIDCGFDVKESFPYNHRLEECKHRFKPGETVCFDVQVWPEACLNIIWDPQIKYTPQRGYCITMDSDKSVNIEVGFRKN